MTITTNRRRVLALLGLIAGSRPALAQFATELVETEPQATEGVRDVGGWHIVSIANHSTATLLPDRIRVAAVSAELGKVGGSAKLEIEYWSQSGGAFNGEISVAAVGRLIGGLLAHVLVDGVEVDTFRPDESRWHLTHYFGEDLAKLSDVKNIRVTLDVGENSRVIYDADLEGTADALTAMKTIPDYNYNVRGLGRPPPDAPAPGTGSGSCFITTACCTLIGLPDDCAELTTLRRFRDEVMAPTPEGRRDIALYYALAPSILANIKQRGDEQRLRWAYFGYILPSAAAARLGLNALAWRIYKRMIRMLTQRYLTRAASV